MSEQAATTAKKGRLSDRRASNQQLKALSNGDWMGLFGLAVASMCSTNNTEQEFEAKRIELMQADLSPFNTCSGVMAHITQLHYNSTLFTFG